MLGDRLRNWFGLRRPAAQVQVLPGGQAPQPVDLSATVEAAPASNEPPTAWPAERLALNDALWGPGYTFPGGEIETLRMAKPMQLTNESTVLLLGAGAGGPACTLSIKFGSWVTGFEVDEDLTVAATERALKANLARRIKMEHWSPSEPAFRERYYNHCVAVEPLRGAQPEPLLTALASALKSGGHLAMMELVADTPLAASNPLVRGWARLEQRPAEGLPTEIVITKTLKRLGFDVRIAEDVSERHIHDALIAWRRSVKELEQNKPSMRHLAQYVSEAELWLLRLRLMEDRRIRLVRWHAIGR